MDQTFLGYLIYRFVGLVAPLVPPRLGYAIARRLGDLGFGVLARSRSNVLDNLRHVLGQRTDPGRLRRLARQAFRTQACNYFDLFRVARLSPESTEALVTVHGWHHVEQAMAAGKGVVLVSAHFGNLDIVAQAIVLRGFRVIVAAEHLRPERLFRYVSSLRASKGMRIIPADGFARPLFAALWNNEIVGLAADRNLTGRGVLVPFFGEPALLPDGHARVARRTGARVLLAFALRRPDDRFDAFVEPPIVVEDTGDAERDINLGMLRVVAGLEKFIGRFPEQWVMFQPVWRLPKSQAQGCPES